jgi:hypothetical protein
VSWLLFDALLASRFSGRPCNSGDAEGGLDEYLGGSLGTTRGRRASENNGHQRQPRRRFAPVTSAIDAHCALLTSCVAEFASRRSPVRSRLAPLLKRCAHIRRPSTAQVWRLVAATASQRDQRILRRRSSCRRPTSVVARRKSVISSSSVVVKRLESVECQSAAIGPQIRSARL